MKTFIVIALLFCTFHAISQKKAIPEFGNIDKSDLEMKECDFDKDAEAYKLLDIGDVSYERGKSFFRMRYNNRERIKILKEKGFEWASIKIRFYSKQGYETIQDISAVTYNLDDAGNIVTTKLEKSSIFIKPIDKHFSEVAFTMPNLKVGSVIEYKYVELKESMEHLNDWYFQGGIPTRMSQYKVLIPSMFKFVCQLLTNQVVEQTSADRYEQVSTSQGAYRYNAIEKTYTLKNIPALREEPYMGARLDYLKRIQFQLSEYVDDNGAVTELNSTWPKLTEQLLDDEDFGRQLKKNIPKTQELDNQLIGISDPYKKMVIIHDYVRRSMNENNISSIYTQDGIRSAWDKKTGSTSEINMVLISLLKSAGIETYPMLASTRDHGSVNTLYPFLQQFNEMLAYVIIKDKSYVLNAADKYNPAHLTPYDILNTEAFIVDKNKGGWVSLNNNKQRFRNVVTLFGEINNDGIMDGEATILSSDYARNPRVQKWKEDRAKFKNYFSSANINLTLDSIEVNNLDNDTLALEQKFKFKSQLNSSGDYKYFTVNLFNGLDKNPFLKSERSTDIDFGYTQSFALFGNISLPAGYKIEELPKNIKMITPDTGIILKRLFQIDDSVLNVQLSVEFIKPVYYASDYDDFKEFYKKMFATLNEQIVLKKIK